MLPAITKVILVEKPLAQTEVEVAEFDRMRIITEIHAANVCHAEIETISNRVLACQFHLHHLTS